MAEFDPIVDARNMMQAVSTAVLGTSEPDGRPFTSLVAIAQLSLCPVLHASTLARHRRNFSVRPDVSLLLTAPETWQRRNPMTAARLTLSGKLEMVKPTDQSAARQAFLDRHPDAEGYVDLPDFDFFRLHVADAYLVAGFGQIQQLPPRRLFGD